MKRGVLPETSANTHVPTMTAALDTIALKRQPHGIIIGVFVGLAKSVRTERNGPADSSHSSPPPQLPKTPAHPLSSKDRLPEPARWGGNSTPQEDRAVVSLGPLFHSCKRQKKKKLTPLLRNLRSITRGSHADAIDS